MVKNMNCKEHFYILGRVKHEENSSSGDIYPKLAFIDKYVILLTFKKSPIKQYLFLFKIIFNSIITISLQ